MSTEHPWIELRPEEFSRLRSEKHLKGAKLTLMISPYDIPEAVRVRDVRGQLIIDFRYISGEVWKKRLKLREGVTLEVGRRSGRIYAVIIDKDLLRAQNSLQITINEALRAPIGGAKNKYSAARIAASKALSELPSPAVV